MIYLDTSVALAHLLAEERRPAAGFWDQPIITSRLLEYEVWVRVNMLGVTRAQEETVRAMLGRIAFVELIPEITARAREKFPLPVRSLDALHLASAAFLVAEGVGLRLASYDARMRDAAHKLAIPILKSF